MNFGSRKRGSLNVKKIKSPIMRLLKQEEKNGVEFVLGFIFAGQSYIIPQIILDYEFDGEFPVRAKLTDTYQGEDFIDFLF